MMALSNSGLYLNYKGSLQMIDESEKVNTIKLYVQLINKMKQRHPIDINNKLLSTSLTHATQSIQLLLELETANSAKLDLSYLLSLRDKLQQINKKETNDENPIYRHMLIKLHALELIFHLISENESNIQTSTRCLIESCRNLAEFAFGLKIMFGISSIYRVGRLDDVRLSQRYASSSEITNVLALVALVRAIDNPKAAEVLLDKLGMKNTNGRPTLQQKKYVILTLQQLRKRQRQLTSAEEEMKMLSPIDSSTKKLIHNTIERVSQVAINGSSLETSQKLSGLQQSVFLYASPLAHLYFEDSVEVIEKVKETALFRSLATSISFIEDANNSISRIEANTKRKAKKNPLAYSNYIKQSMAQNETKYAPLCKLGCTFVKYNFGNAKQNSKFVLLNDRYFQYSGKREQIESGTKCNQYLTQGKIEELLGLHYGKSSIRHQETEIQPKLCFSIFMKDRTVDFSVEYEDQLEELFNFLRGFSYILNSYHSREQARIQSQKKAISKKADLTKLNEQAFYHSSKEQRFTKGRLLWSQLIYSLNTKNLVKPKNKTYPKLEGIKSVRVGKNKSS